MIGGRVALAVRGRAATRVKGVARLAPFVASLAAVLLLLPLVAFAGDTPPHVTPDEGPDACAMCHRAHSAPGVVARRQFGSWEMTGSALVLARPSDTGDAALCLTCHGIDALGAATEVQSGFLGASAHSMMPRDSRYDDVPPKQCSSCHDAHGAERRIDGTPYPGLLRSIARDGHAFYSREEYCGACHFDSREGHGNRFDGLAVYRQTAHAAMPLPASGTGITCSNCHAPHGSDIAPLIRSEIATPAAPAVTDVAANDRRLCYACHATGRATWLGAGVYDDETTRTVHGSSEVTLPVMAEYASEATARRAGECQSCHNPMGSDDGEGRPLPRLTELEGRELCYSCHNAEKAPTVPDMASWAVRAERLGGQPELVVSWDPETILGAYGGLHVYTRAFADDAAPYGLEGPRPYRVAGAGARTGAIASGDIDGLVDRELVVADPASSVLRVFRADALAGLAYVTHGIVAPAVAVEIGDFLLEGTGRPEIAVLTVEASGASHLELYRWQPGGDHGTLASAAGPYLVGYDATGLAAGSLGLGASAVGLVVTARSAAATQSADAVFVAYQAAAGDAGVRVDSWPAQVDGVRGPSVGPVRGGAPAIVTANSGAATPSISVYAPDGTSHSEHPVYGAVGATAWDTVIGAFAADGGTAVAVAVRNETGDGGVSIFPVTGTGFGARHDVPTGEGSASSTLGVGRLTRDSAEQIVVANAGVLSWADGQSVSPSVQVIEWTDAAFEVVGTHWGGGTESAGGSPAVAVVDLGPVGRSRHPASAVSGAHVSTETAGFPRHVECVDCHNVHAATGEPADSPPHVYGAIRGTRGLDPYGAELAPVEQVAYEYQLCLKCHATPAWGGSRRDIAAELDPSNEGFHPVVAASGVARNNPDSFVGGWGPGSKTYCTDCHGNAGSGPAGPHVSPQAPLLSRPFAAARPAETGLLCYRCHRQTVYHDGSDDSPTPDAGSLFYDAETGTVLHAEHTRDHGLGCGACHVSHGGDAHLVRDGIGWAHHPANGGACVNACHSLNGVRAYSRSLAVESPTAVEIQASSGHTGELASLGSQDGDALAVSELESAYGPVLRVQIDFHPVVFPSGGAPTSLEVFGFYGGVDDSHIQVEAYNWTTSEWDALGTLPGTAASARHTYALIDAAYVSEDRVRVRFDHGGPGVGSRTLSLDRVWLRH